MPCSRSCPYVTCPNDPCGPFSTYPYLPCRCPACSVKGGPCRKKCPRSHNVCCCGKMIDEDAVPCSGVYICRDGYFVKNCHHCCCRDTTSDNNCNNNCCNCQTCNSPGKCCGYPPTSIIPLSPCGFFTRNCNSCRSYCCC